LDSPTGQPDRKALAVVISSRGGVEVTLAQGQPADFAPPVNDGGFEKPTLLEVL
jgi:hypothetical protein